MPSPALVSFFQIVSILGSLFTVIKLLTSGLYKRYRVFFVYFAFRIPYMTCFLILGHMKGLPGGDGIRSFAYFRVFLYTEPLLILFYVLVVVELYSLVLEKYRGLYTLGRWAMYGSVVIAVIISLLSMLPKIQRSTSEPSRWFIYEIATERGVQLALVIFILLIVLFLSRYPVPLSRNVVVHTAIYSVFFLSETLVLLLRTLFGFSSNDAFNLIVMAITAACTVIWGRMLNAKGEETQVNAPTIRPDAEERILQQLDALNQTLLKVSRK